jgi:type VI secretion system protein ImpL
LNLIKDTPTWYKWFYGSAAGSLAILAFALFLYFGAKAEGRQSFNKKRKNSQGDDVKELAKVAVSSVTPSLALSLQIRDHLRHRYTFFWHHKTRLLLITGDEAAIEQLVS